MRLGRAEDDASRRFGDGTSDLHAATAEVDVHDAERRRLAPPQAGVREEQHERPGVAAFVGETVDLRVREVAALGLDATRKLDALGWVADEPTIPHGKGEDEREDGVDVAHGLRRESLREVADPVLDLGVADVAQAAPPPPRDDVLGQRALVPHQGRRLELGLTLEPVPRPGFDVHSRERWVDV